MGRLLLLWACPTLSPKLKTLDLELEPDVSVGLLEDVTQGTYTVMVTTRLA